MGVVYKGKNGTSRALFDTFLRRTINVFNLIVRSVRRTSEAWESSEWPTTATIE